MSETTANLVLPYILPSQAQKHVTHNEALQRLDAAVQLCIRERRAAPPAEPAEGDCYAVAPAAEGAWAGSSGRIAVRQDGDWIFLQPRGGWRAWFAADHALRIHDGGEWTDMPLPPQGTMQRLGISTSADETNRLAVSSEATLLTHAGAGHQLKLNKAMPADTASLLFQSGWSGRAEMGLAGDDGFSIKVSTDGAAWLQALTISGAGRVRMPHNPLACAAMSEATVAKSDGSSTGFQLLHSSRGGFELGAVVPGGSGNRLIVPEHGIYLLGLSLVAAASGTHGIDLRVNGTTVAAAIRNAATGAVAASSCAIALAPLSAGDWLSLHHAGTADVQFGQAKTCLTAVML